jgi:oligopeptide transport system permease protein
MQSLVSVLIIVTIVFLLIRLLPTDYFFTEDQLMKFTEQQKNEQLLAAGLLDPIPVQLFKFYAGLVRFDFGVSRRIQSGVPVWELIGRRFAISMRLGLTAVGYSMLIGISLGILQARYKNRLLDHVGMGYTIFVNAVPPLVSYSLILIFGSRVLGFPSLYSSRNPGISSILPIVCLTFIASAWWAIWIRRYMIDEINKDYIKLAKIKGMATRDIMVKHVLRNAFVPVAQYLPATLLMTIGGSVLVERFFSVPGMGPLLIDSINRYDLNLVQALVVLYSVLSIMGVFLGDVLMMIVDPRISLTKKAGTR